MKLWITLVITLKTLQNIILLASHAMAK
uniref:Uncharacterized protein n=1 Tax=Arundo donax TaxID=35708 RepID=A0A0A9C9G6_ARUDO